MSTTAKHLLRAGFSALGLNLRFKSDMAGNDPLQDIKAFRPGDAFKTIIDIGANVGQSALRFHRAFPEATIHSFEPVASSYEAGRRNTAKYASINWHRQAMGDAEGKIVFYSSGVSQTNRITNTEALHTGAASERNEAEIVRLDDFLAASGIERVDLMKTDTEGLDFAVLKGSTAALAAQRIGYLLCEVGFSHADTSHSPFLPIAEFLEGFGYRLFGFYGISDVDHFRQWGITYADALFAVPSPLA